MNILLWIILGGLAGWIASVLMRTNATQTVWWDIIIGIIGALIGGFIMSFFGRPGVTGFNVYSLVVAVVGAVVLILLGRVIQRST